MNLLEKSTMLATLGLFCFLTASNMAAAKAVEFFGIHPVSYTHLRAHET